MRPVVLNRIAFVLCILGLLVAGTLSISAYLGVIPPCRSDGGCGAVAAHSSSKWFGIPVAYFGLGTYLVLAVLTAARLIRTGLPNRRLALAGYAVSAVGTIASIALTIYSITEIKATCDLCLASAGIMTLLFITHAILVQAEPETQKADRTFDLGLLCALSLGLVLGLSVATVYIQKGPKITVNNSELDSASLEYLVPEGAHTLGPNSAPVTVIEFADLLCPACKATFPEVQKLIAEQHGNVRFVFRHFPLHQAPGHEMSLPAAIASEYVAEDGLFWDFLGQIYSEEDHISKMSDVIAIAQMMNVTLTPDQLSDTETPAFDRVLTDLETANQLGLAVTPTFIIVAEGLPNKVVGERQLRSTLESPEYARLIKPSN